MQTEIWKNIENYNGLYQISNLGRVKSLERTSTRGDKELKIKGKILKAKEASNGYRRVSLSKYGKVKYFNVHSLVANSFLQYQKDLKGKHVDHINNIKSDNRLENLQIISHRENLSKDKVNGLSKYTGVTKGKNSPKWKAGIKINGKQKHLGVFDCEKEASEAYQNKLNTLK